MRFGSTYAKAEKTKPDTRHKYAFERRRYGPTDGRTDTPSDSKSESSQGFRPFFLILLRDSKKNATLCFIHRKRLVILIGKAK